MTDEAPQTQPLDTPKQPRPDFTPKHDWASIIPRAQALLATGETQLSVAALLGVHPAYLSAKLTKTKRKAQRLQDREAKKLEGSKVDTKVLTPTPTGQVKAQTIQAPSGVGEGEQTEILRSEAAETLLKIAKGQMEAKPGQVQALKMLRDSHQDTDEPNPYAGTPDHELAERVLTMAASVLGVHACAIILRDLARGGQADVSTMTPQDLEALGQLDQTPHTDTPQDAGPDPNEVKAGR